MLIEEDPEALQFLRQTFRVVHAVPKGLPEKLEGFRVFLDQHPEWSEKVVLIQIAIPSREAVKKYQDLEGEVNKLVGQITGKYGK
jgi:trehalose-6-phosphate synthase